MWESRTFSSTAIRLNLELRQHSVGGGRLGIPEAEEIRPKQREQLPASESEGNKQQIEEAKYKNTMQLHTAKEVLLEILHFRIAKEKMLLFMTSGYIELP
jgi:hypothetical protein